MELGKEGVGSSVNATSGGKGNFEEKNGGV
jgi:hypothetical protein